MLDRRAQKSINGGGSISSSCSGCYEMFFSGQGGTSCTAVDNAGNICQGIIDDGVCCV
ncbi:MAG: hypothetical protein AB8G15_06985 [Saprospiraceae bacterium]